MFLEDRNDRVAHGAVLGQGRAILLAIARGHFVAAAVPGFEIRVMQSPVQNVLDRTHRCARRRGEIIDEIPLEFVGNDAGTPDERVQGGNFDLDDLRARLFHLFDGLPDDPPRLAVLRRVAEVGSQHADACTAERGRIQRVHETGEGTAFERACGGVGGVGSDGRVEPDGEVRGGARQGTSHILRVRQRNDAVDAGESLRGTQAEQIVVRCRNPNRSARVTPPTEDGEVRGDCGARATARAARIA